MLFNSSMYTIDKQNMVDTCRPTFVAFKFKVILCSKFQQNIDFLHKTARRARQTLATLSDHIKDALPTEVPRNWGEGDK